MKVISALEYYTVTLILVFCGAWCTDVVAQKPNKWPSLTHYDTNHVERVAMPLGGIGTGTVSLTGRGGLRDWEIMNRPAKGYNPWFGQKRKRRSPFFAINIQKGDSTSITRLIEGPPKSSDYEGSQGSTMENHGLPRFSTATFDAAYPFGQAHLRDPSLPVNVTVKGFNPLIPGQVDDSSLPVAVLKYEVKNKTDDSLSVSIAGTIQNFIGFDGQGGDTNNNTNSFKSGGKVEGIYFQSDGVPKESEQWGTIALTSISEGSISYRTNWLPRKWGQSTLDFWRDLSNDGEINERNNKNTDNPIASLSVERSVPANSTSEFTFLITWHFPNRKGWYREDVGRWDLTNIGNHYTARYDNAWDVAINVSSQLERLEEESLRFVNSFIATDVPHVIKEAALFTLANLRTQTVFRSEEGHLFGWEGTFSHIGAGPGSTTHVWNYQQALPFLFGDLAKTMREVEFRHATDSRGLMSFRVHLPLDSAKVWGKAAADGQMGAIMKLYREWQLSGDDNFLRRLWPKAKKAMKFAWINNGWDEDKDGVMEGPQHNTMDVEYVGPNPQMSFWYLGALRACNKMATYLSDQHMANTCQRLYSHGSDWIDRHLYNGEYYEQIIRPINNDSIPPFLIHNAGTEDFSDPRFQLGDGVLVDQLVGQLMSNICNLGYLADKDNIRKTLDSIFKYNYKNNLSQHFNVMRSFALGNESGMVMASYPAGVPEAPFSYFSEVMTGFEYTAANSMIYENKNDQASKIYKSVRERYDGKKRNPFNEAEYGNHYTRAMAAWGGLIAWTGFNFSRVDNSFHITSEEGQYFWSNGYEYGTVNISNRDSNSKVVEIISQNGSFRLKTIHLNTFAEEKLDRETLIQEDTEYEFTVTKK